MLWLKSNGNSTCDSVYFTTVNALFNCFISVHWTGCASCIINIVRIHHRTTFVEQRMMEGFFVGSDGDNCSHKMCKAPVRSSPPTNQLPFLLPNQVFHNTVREQVSPSRRAHPKLTWRFSNSVFVHSLPVTCGRGCQASHQPSLNASTPRITKRTLYKLLRYRSPVPEHRA